MQNDPLYSNEIILFHMYILANFMLGLYHHLRHVLTKWAVRRHRTKGDMVHWTLKISEGNKGNFQGNNAFLMGFGSRCIILKLLSLNNMNLVTIWKWFFSQLISHFAGWGLIFHILFINALIPGSNVGFSVLTTSSNPAFFLFFFLDDSPFSFLDFLGMEGS